MPETLLTPSSIKLYGRVVKDLKYIDDSAGSVLGYNNFLQSQLSGGATIVTVYGTANGSNATVTSVSSVVGLFPGMTITATSPGGIFSPGTTIASVSSGSFTVSNANQVQQSSQNAVITATNIPVTPSGSPPIPSPSVFARIYAFSFEGAIYTLPRPSMFLVHGQGSPVDITAVTSAVTTTGTSALPNANANAVTSTSTTSATPVGRTSLDVSGVMAREWEFSAPQNPASNQDLRYWEYEKGDFSIRLDSEAGQFEQILLAAALRAGADMADRSGASLGVRSGASLAGASLAGASLSGASLSGASLSGASLSGASLRNGR
jgi:Pentapeptide repeats (8 copies)